MNENVRKEPVVFIINPIAGSRSKKNIPDLIKQLVDEERFTPIIRFTRKAGHATELARKSVKRGARFIFAGGGDGTVNEVARALVGTKAALGIIPLGSGNGLARQLEVPLRTDKAISVLHRFKVVSIDYGVANETPFFCTCGVGFDAKISHDFAEMGTRGFYTYFKTTVHNLFSYRPKRYKIKVDGVKHKYRAFLVTVANAQQYGNNAFIAPLANIQDGKLDISVLRPFPGYSMIGLAVKLFRKKIDKSSYVDSLRGKEIVLKRKKPGPFHFDGEPVMMGKKIHLHVVPHGLRVIVPRNSSLTNNIA
jgi:YegS/Rv2252/BmrU family lipid kinase